MLHLRGGRGRESYDRTHIYLIDYRTYAAIFRSEVMTPLRDAMGLVDCIKRYFYRLEKLYVLLLCQRLGSDIKQLGESGPDVGLDSVDGRAVERRVEEMSHMVCRTEMAHGVDLILHQGYQWRYHYGSALHHECGELVAQRFATACGHKDKDILTLE